MKFDLDKTKTGLIIVDMQNDFVRQGGAMRVVETIPTIEPINRLKAFARENGMPVFFTRFLTGPKRTFLWNWSPQSGELKNCRRGLKKYYPDIDKEELCADVIDELKPVLEKDFIIDKYNYSAFRNTNLHDAMLSVGLDTLIVTGTVTQICVETTVMDGYANQIQMVVASDCVSSFSEELHKATLDNITMKFGVVMTSEEIIKALS